MKLFSVPVSIYRLPKLRHCDNCGCRGPKQLISVEYITVSEKVKDVKDSAKSHVSSMWYAQRQEDWGGIEFEAGEPIQLSTEVVS